MVHAPADPPDLGIVLPSCSLEPTGYTEQERPDSLILLPCYETMSLQIGSAARHSASSVSRAIRRFSSCCHFSSARRDAVAFTAVSTTSAGRAIAAGSLCREGLLF